MKNFINSMLMICLLAACETNTKPLESRGMNTGDSMPADTSMNKPASEIAEARYMDVGKQMMQYFESGDYDSWKNYFSDSAVYIYSAGDSIQGKEAIASYWKDRRTQYIDSIAFSNDIWIPININTPQQGPDMPGVWLLNWQQVDVKYKSGKSLNFWMHSDYHFNEQDKVDRAVIYVDRAPIRDAQGK